MYHNVFIHSSVDGYLGCFHVLGIVNSAAVNNGIHVSFSILVSSGYLPRSGIAVSYGGFIPSFLRNLHTIFWASLIAQPVKNIPAMQETWVQFLDQEDPWRRKWQPTPVFLPGKSHGQRSLVGCSPWGLKRVRLDWATKTNNKSEGVIPINNIKKWNINNFLCI